MKKQINTFLAMFAVLLATNVMLDGNGRGPDYVLLKMQMDAFSNKANIYSQYYSMQYQQIKLKLSKS